MSSFYEKAMKSSLGKRAGSSTKEEMKVVQNPLLQAIGSRKFLVLLDDKKFKLDTDESIDSLIKLKTNIAQIEGLQLRTGAFDLEYFDADVEEFVQLTNWQDLPVAKVVKLKINEKEGLSNLISSETILGETGNEIIVCRENKKTKKMELCLHPVNYPRMRRDAINQWCPVVSFLGPTGGGKSSLICKFNPNIKPVTAVDSQPIPTTSNVNQFVGEGFDGLPHVRFLDVEGEDGGLPLMEYCKSEGINLGPTANLSPDDIVEFVKTVFSNCDPAELNAYFEARKEVTKKSFTRLAYIISDVIVYVNTVPAKRESEYLERVLDFAAAAQKGISSAERPSLIMIYNQCKKTEAPFDIDQSTEHFFLLVDREKRLLESFRSVDFVKLPDWDHPDLYRQQFTAFEQRLRRRVKEQGASKAQQGTLFSEQVWFNIVEKVIDHFAEDNLSMGKIFSRVLLSESSLVNRAYSFFDITYGSVNEKQRFLICRQIAVKTLAVFIVMQSREHGHSALASSADVWLKLLDELLAAVKRRTPCEAVFAGRRCTQELATHDSHRFRLEDAELPEAAHLKSQKSFVSESLDDLLGGHQFSDPESKESIVKLLTTTLQRLMKIPSSEEAAFFKERLYIFREGIVNGSLASFAWEHLPREANSAVPRDKCLMCLRSRPNRMLACTHSFCAACVSGIIATEGSKQSSQQLSLPAPIPGFSQGFGAAAAGKIPGKRVACPLCLNQTEVTEPVPRLPGSAGVRILSLDGGGFRALLQVHVLHRVLSITGLQLGDLFDLVAGSGSGGILALALAVRRASLEDCEALLDALPARLTRKKLLQRVIGTRLHEFLFGSAYSVEAYEEVLREFFTSEVSLMSDVIRNATPKACALTCDSSTLLEPVLFANYPPGARSHPMVDCTVKVWEAARATYANPDVQGVFKKEGCTYVDGSMVCNNPAELAVFEAYNMWQYERDVDVLVSLGSSLTALKAPKSEHLMRYLNKTADLVELSLEVDTSMKALSEHGFPYIRINPELGVEKRQTIKRKHIQELSLAMDAWLDHNPAVVQQTAAQLLSRAFYVDIAPGAEWCAGKPVLLSIRLRLGSSSSPPATLSPSFASVIERLHGGKEEFELPRPNQVNVDHWQLSFAAPPRAGFFRCHVFVTLERGGPRFRVGGSPFLVPVLQEDGTECELPLPVPLQLAMPYVQFYRSVALNETSEAAQKADVDKHAERLQERVLYHGVRDVSMSSRADPSCLFKAVSEQLFQSRERHHYVRKVVAGWLRAHPTFQLADNSQLHQAVRKVGWDDYCDRIEKESTWGDALCLLAVAEFLGVRVVVISSVESVNYVTELRPSKWKRVEPVLLAHRSDFRYTSMKPHTSSFLFRPESVTAPAVQQAPIQFLRKRTGSLTLPSRMEPASDDESRMSMSRQRRTSLELSRPTSEKAGEPRPVTSAPSTPAHQKEKGEKKEKKHKSSEHRSSEHKHRSGHRSSRRRSQISEVTDSEEGEPKPLGSPTAAAVRRHPSLDSAESSSESSEISVVKEISMDEPAEDALPQVVPPAIIEVPLSPQPTRAAASTLSSTPAPAQTEVPAAQPAPPSQPPATPLVTGAPPNSTPISGVEPAAALEVRATPGTPGTPAAPSSSADVNPTSVPSDATSPRPPALQRKGAMGNIAKQPQQPPQEDARTHKRTLSRSRSMIPPELKRMERELPLPVIPDYLGERVHARESLRVIARGCVLATYRASGHMIVASTGEKEPWVLDGVAEPVLCLDVRALTLACYHGNGVIQLHSVTDRTSATATDPNWNAVRTFTHPCSYFSPQPQAEKGPRPHCLLLDPQRVLVAYPGKVCVWPRVGCAVLTSGPVETLLLEAGSALHGLQQRFCSLRYPLVLLASKTQAQIWDLEKKKLLLQAKTVATTSTFLHVRWEGNTLLTITSSELQLFSMDNPQAASLTVPLESVITALHLDEHVLVTGDQEGLLAVWTSQSGRKLHYLNATNVPGSPQMERLNAEEDSIAAAFAFRINSIRVQYTEPPPKTGTAGVKGLSAQVIASHEDARVTVWNLQLSTQEQPLQSFHVRSPVRDLVLCDEGEVQAVLPPPQPPTLLSWYAKARPSISPSHSLASMTPPISSAPSLPAPEPKRFPATTSEEHVRMLTSASFHGKPTPPVASTKELVASSSFHVGAVSHSSSSSASQAASVSVPASTSSVPPTQPNRALSNPNFARSPTPEPVHQTDSSRSIPYSKLRARDVPADVDRLNLERYLSDTEFQQVFGMDRAMFYNLPRWKQSSKKKEKDLF